VRSSCCCDVASSRDEVGFSCFLIHARVQAFGSFHEIWTGTGSMLCMIARKLKLLWGRGPIGKWWLGTRPAGQSETDGRFPRTRYMYRSVYGGLQLFPTLFILLYIMVYGYNKSNLERANFRHGIIRVQGLGMENPRVFRRQHLCTGTPLAGIPKFQLPFWSSCSKWRKYRHLTGRIAQEA